MIVTISKSGATSAGSPVTTARSRTSLRSIPFVQSLHASPASSSIEAFSGPREAGSELPSARLALEVKAPSGLARDHDRDARALVGRRAPEGVGRAAQERLEHGP